MYRHPPDRKGYHFSANEIAEAGIACLEATNGNTKSPFVIVKVTPIDKVIQMEAFQITSTCLEMIMNDALLKMPSNPGFFAVQEKFQAIVEAKSAVVIDTDYLIKRVPIKQHSSELSSKFPHINREHLIDSPSPKEALRSLLKNSTKPADLRKALKDFQLLLYLSANLGVETAVEIVDNLLHAPEDDPLPEGFYVLIQHLAEI